MAPDCSFVTIASLLSNVSKVTVTPVSVSKSLMIDSGISPDHA